MNRAKANFKLFIAIMVALILLLFGSIATYFVSPSKALALSSTSSAVQAGEGKELWDTAGNNFNALVVKDIVKKLFGTQDPVSYVKTRKDAQTDSYVIPAPTINQKVGNTSYGFVVKLGGKEWMVTSLTLADVDGKKDNVILTLYLSTSIGNSQFYSSASNVKGENVYSRSIIRNHLLTHTNWSLFNRTGANTFASEYLVQPKYIKYQQTQSDIGRGSSSATNSPNDALSAVSGAWYQNMSYKPDDMYDGIRYDAWGNDYLWIPSLLEVGNENGSINNSSIWLLNSNQRRTSGTATSWLRTGSSGFYRSARFLTNTGDNSNAYVSSSNGVRPAIHLNLTAAIDGIANKSDNPTDLTSTYNEKAQTLNQIASADTEATWYDNDFYNKSGNINITYPDSTKTFENAGEYWVKFEITQAYINAVNTAVDNEGAANGWTAEYIAKVKERRKPKFIGEADKSDSEHLESDTVRWIKITIEKAEIDFTKVVWGSDNLEYNGLKQSIEISSGYPTFLTFTYSNNSKTDVGSYKAQVVGITTTNDNYKIPTSTELVSYSTLKHDWQITKKKLTANWTHESKTQNGVTISFPVLSLADNLKDSIEYTYYRNAEMTESISVDDIFAEFDIDELQIYYVKATLKSSGGTFNASNTTFVRDGADVSYVETVLETGSTENSVRVEITNSKFTFNNKEQKAVFSVSGGGLTADSLIVTYYSLDGTLLLSAPKNAGKYKAKVKLKANLTDFILIGQTEFEFEIESLKIKKPNASQIQFFKADGYVLSDIANLPNGWENYFNIKAYDKDNNEILPTNNNWGFVNVNNYRIEISFKSGINTASGGSADNVIWSDSDKNTFEVALEIKPLVFNIEGWKEGTGNKKPVITGADAKEIAKYFDYEIYELRNGVIVGNMLPYDATLKYNTDYQITLKVKDEFSGNVFLEYNGETISETETHKFKTETSSNPNDGDNEDNESNGGLFGSGGTDAWFGTNGKLPLFAWILVGSNLLTILLLIILVIALLRSRNNKDKYERVTPTTPVANNNEQVDNNKIADSNINSAYVNGSLMKNSDWTFIVREKDILNLKVLENQSERVLMYCCRESEIKKLKKFQNAIAEEVKDYNSESDNQNDSNASKSKSKKRKR
ncbi:MAG: hypothetical protein K2P12_03150 [Clostridia bacterium]|nr:hypothetical protein [Clostridia bacterium]